MDNVTRLHQAQALDRTKLTPEEETIINTVLSDDDIAQLLAITEKLKKSSPNFNMASIAN